jgi:hypothetical protein
MNIELDPYAITSFGWNLLTMLPAFDKLSSPGRSVTLAPKVCMDTSIGGKKDNPKPLVSAA